MVYANNVRNWGFAFLALLLSIVAWTAFAFYQPTEHNPLAAFAAKNHITIMGVLVIVAVAFGFFLAQFFYRQLQQSRQASHNIMEIVLLFLGKEEKIIIQFLIEKGGETNQAELSRLPNMTRVKVHRSLQKMQEKQLLDITSHGKIRKVKLKEHIKATLQNVK